MLKFDKNLYLKIQNAVDQFPHLLDFLRDKKFRVADTSLSYRQINSLDESMILNAERDSKKGWRKFNFLDVIYIHMIREIRGYGVENDKIQSLKDLFYSEMDDDKKLYFGEYAILATLIGIRINWVLLHGGASLFCDMDSFVDLNGDVEPEQKSYLCVNLNQVMRRVFEKQDSTYIPMKEPSLGTIIKNYMQSILSDKEIEILNIIKNDDYTKITIIKKGDKAIVYGEAIKNSNKISEKEILRYFESKSFSNIQVQKRNGEIVSYRVEDVFKIQ